MVDLYQFVELISGGAVGTRSVTYSGGTRALPGLFRFTKSFTTSRVSHEYTYSSMHEWVDYIASPLACRALLYAAELVKSGVPIMCSEHKANICLGELVRAEYAGRIYFAQVVAFFVEQFTDPASWRTANKGRVVMSMSMTNDAYANLCYHPTFRIARLNTVET